MAKTPIFSPYVVFGGPPKQAAIIVAIPSPNIDRSKPGSSIKSLFTTLLKTN